VLPNEQFIRGIYDAMDRRDGRSLVTEARFVYEDQDAYEEFWS
jgi:hypothetical protein